MLLGSLQLGISLLQVVRFLIEFILELSGEGYVPAHAVAAEELPLRVQDGAGIPTHMPDRSIFAKDAVLVASNALAVFDLPVDLHGSGPVLGVDELGEVPAQHFSLGITEK